MGHQVFLVTGIKKGRFMNAEIYNGGFGIYILTIRKNNKTG
jgi:hypothetical protein